MTNDKQRVDFPVGENVREDKRGTPRGRLVELFEQLEDPSLTCPRMGTNARCGGCKYLKRDGCDLTGRFVDYFLANGVIVLPCKIGDIVWCNIEGFDRPLKGMIRRVSVSKDFTTISTGVEGYFAQDYLINDFGKTVFLTKEEAEQALNNIQNGNSCEGGAE